MATMIQKCQALLEHFCFVLRCIIFLIAEFCFQFNNEIYLTKIKNQVNANTTIFEKKQKSNKISVLIIYVTEHLHCKLLAAIY